jgi:hypothetical protein
MSPEAKKLLEDSARATGMTMTQVLEVCVAKHALEIPGISSALKVELTKMLAKLLMQDNR